MSPERIINCPDCGYRMHELEVTCLKCQLLAEWREEQLKAWIADRLRQNNPQLAKRWEVEV